jgi:hypothetical protein
MFAILRAAQHTLQDKNFWWIHLQGMPIQMVLLGLISSIIPAVKFIAKSMHIKILS